MALYVPVRTERARPVSPENMCLYVETVGSRPPLQGMAAAFEIALNGTPYDFAGRGVAFGRRQRFHGEGERFGTDIRDQAVEGEEQIVAIDGMHR
jgi:hypothetical protein